ncbi:MAG: DUF2249 domain-containing protein [Haloferacaceae archaeon]
MAPQTDLLDRFADTGVPTDRDVELLDVRALGPPKPLTETLETLADLDEDLLLLQRNDRAPQHLYPQLEDRGYDYETVELDDQVLTAIWSPHD